MYVEMNCSRHLNKTQIKIISFKKQKHKYLFQNLLGKAFNGSVVNQAYHSIYQWRFT